MALMLSLHLFNGNHRISDNAILSLWYLLVELSPDVLPPEIDREKHSKKVYGLEKLLKQGQNFTRLKMDDRWIRRRGQMGWYFNKLQFVIVTIFKTIFLMMASRFLSVYQLVHLNWCKNSTTASLQNCSIINWNTVIQITIWSRGC